VNRIFLCMTILVALFLSFGLCSCGDDDDDDDNDDTGDDDDDSDDDDVVDDDDDDDDDDTGGGDVEYDPVYCDLPDPLGIAPNMVGGGPITGTITVYAFSEECEPIEDAYVLHDGTVYQTDAAGKVEISIAKGSADQRVTSWIEFKGAVSYKADAKHMYFLHAVKIGDWSDSPTGDFLEGGDPLGLTNPDISGLLPLQDIVNAVVYLGAAIPGVSRNTIFRFDFNHLFSQAQFGFDSGPLGGVMLFPGSIYMPDLSIEIGALGTTIAGVNEHYTVPVNAMWDENPIEGIVASVSLSEVATEQVLGDLIQTLIDGGSVFDVLTGLISPLISEGISIEYVGVDPEWGGAGAPDLEVGTPSEAVELSVSNISKSNDYLALLLAEIPNRALLPLSLGMIDSGTAQLTGIEIENADYMALVLSADLETLFYASPDGLSFSLAAQHVEDLDQFADGIEFDADTDFLPPFDVNNTGFYWQGGQAGKIYWDLSDNAEADMYGVIYDPACTGCPAIYATVPSDENEYVIPYAELGITLSELDVVAVVAGNLDGFDHSEFNPLTVFGEPISALAIWTNFTIPSPFKSD
jgi:hypothetical protein